MKPDILFENFEMLANAPNGVPKLRKMILQLAVQGKLVPQDPKDEPASVLLEKIGAEKKRLIKENKTRKIKPLPPIEPREIPYELPEGWTWTRIGNVGNIFNGNSVNARLKDEKYTNINGGLPFIATKDVGYGWEELYYDNGVSIPKDEPKFKVAHKGAVLICSEGGSAGKKCGITNRDICFGNKLYAIELYVNVESSYILANYLSPMFFLQFSDNMTGIIGGISAAKFRQLILPVPPLAEQHRIVTKFDHFMAICDELEARKKKRDKTRIALNDAALDRLLSARKQKDFTKYWNRIHRNFDLLYDTPETVDKLRQSILQLAVQGKLVPQDPKEEAASVLLEKIKAEKERLIKKKKLRKVKSQPPVLDDEIPHELPNWWERTRISDVVECRLGKMLDKSKNKGILHEYLRNTNVQWLRFDMTDIKKMRFQDDELPKFEVKYGDLLVCEGGEPGRCAVWELKDKKIMFQKAIHRIRPYFGIEVWFLLYQIWAAEGSGRLKTYFTGATIKHLTGKQLSRFCFGLPPLNEQRRIVAKVDQLMALCDELDTKLSQSQSDCDELLNVIVSNIENVSARKSQIIKNTKAITKKIEPNKISPIQEYINIPEKMGASISKPQTKKEKPKKKFDKLEVLRAFRKAIFRQNDIDELTLLKLTCHRLDIKRLSQPIRHELESHINTAIRRKILYRDGNGYIAGSPTIEHYDDDFLIKVLRSVTLKGWEYQREHLVEESASYLGFDKASDTIKDRMKSVFRKALREKALYRNGDYVGKV